MLPRNVLRKGLLRNANGLTTMELLVVLAVFGIVLAASLPGFRSMMDGWRHRNSVTQLTSRMFLTRQMAVRDGIPYVFIIDPATDRYRIYGDADEDGIQDAGERSLGPYQLENDLQLVNVDWAGNQTTFLPNGSASQTGDIRVVDGRNRSRTIRVNSITGNAEVLP